MKTRFLILLAFCFIQIAEANDQKKIKPAVKLITVFLNRAQINSTASVSLDGGTTDIVLEGLAPFIDPQSIQISGKGDFIIMSVKHSLNYIDGQTKSKEVEVLEDSIESIQFRLDMFNGFRDVLNKEEQMILANQSIKGDNIGVTQGALEDMADFYRERLMEIRTEVLKNNKNVTKTSLILQKYQNQLNELNKLRNQPTGQIVVTVSSKSAKNANLEISYVVSNAGWYPLYDLRAKDSKSPVQLSYKAQVYQSTGIDWNNVKLKLSTANPSLGGTKPTLSAWYLNIYEPYYNYNKTAPQKRSMTPRSAESAPSMAPQQDKAEEYMPAETVADYTQVVETTLAAEFDISIPYSIPSDGVGQLVDIKNYDLPTTYKYSAVPKLDKDAFLMGQVTGWEDLNLLSGNANIYFEGTYVGQSFLDMQNTKDTLDLSLGRDSKVVIERKKQVDFTSKKLVGTNKKEDYAYEIIVRNTKKDPIEITLEDQMPVSQNSLIEVEVIDKGGAEYDPLTGKLVWKLKLNSAEAKSIVFKYSVKYPKGKNVTGLN